MTAPTVRSVPRARAARAGFTLTELLVAIMVLTVGVLGLASTASVVSRTMGEGSQQAVAASVARSRVEQLRSAAWSCANLRTDSTVARGVKQVWVVTPVNARAVLVTLTVSYRRRRYDAVNRTYQRTTTYRSTILCN